MHGTTTYETMGTAVTPLFTAMGAGILLMTMAALVVAFVMRAGVRLPRGF